MRDHAQHLTQEFCFVEVKESTVFPTVLRPGTREDLNQGFLIHFKAVFKVVNVTIFLFSKELSFESLKWSTSTLLPRNIFHLGCIETNLF